MFRLSIAATVFAVVLPAVCFAQEEAVPRPQVKQGDTWTYRRVDLWSNKPVGAFALRVVFVSDKAIQVVTTSDPKALLEQDETWTPEWNAVSTTRNVFVPDTGMLKFPLQRGKTYKVSFENTFGPQRDRRVRHERTAKVIGWEEVEVPAGKFRALKLEVDGSFQRTDASISGSAKDVIWYVPEVKRWVKWTYEDATFRGRVNWYALELTAYKVD